MNKKILRECCIVLDDVTVAFDGSLLAKVEYKKQRDFSEVVDCWEELSLFRTATGQYVCQSRMKEDGVQTERLAVLPNFAEIRRFFGHGWLAEELYREARLTSTGGEKP